MVSQVAGDEMPDLFQGLGRGTQIEETSGQLPPKVEVALQMEQTRQGGFGLRYVD